jgi:hypothetical protein
LRDLSELKLTRDFLGVNILSREAAMDQEINERGHGAQTRLGGAGPRPSHATQVHLDLRPPMSSIFILDQSAWPQNAYIKTPRGVPLRRRRRKTKQRNRGCSMKIWGGNAAIAARPLLQPLWNHQHHHHDEDGVVHLWTMGLRQ